MNKENFIKYAEDKFSGESLKILLNQIDLFYSCNDNFIIKENSYSVGDDVVLKKGTLLHGTYRNIDGLKNIIKNGLIASWFIDGRISKYPSSVGVWNLKKNYLLKDYIDFYSGGTIRYNNMGDSVDTKTQVVPYSEMKNIMKIIDETGYFRWYMEQTKEARFMPSLVQDEVQIGIIFNSDNEYIEKLKQNDILSQNINDKVVKLFVNEKFSEDFIKLRKEKDDFFTDRESAILFGIPSCFIEGILVGRTYENDKEKLDEIKQLLPSAYICNLDGKVIVK